MSEKSYDPILRQAAIEIREVLKKHDCVGLFNLGSRTHGEFLLHTEASWSYVTLEDTQHGQGKMGIRFKAKGVKPGTKEHEDLEATAGFVMNTADFCNRFGQIMYRIKSMLAEKMEIDYQPMTDDRISNEDRQ